LTCLPCLSSWILFYMQKGLNLSSYPLSFGNLTFSLFTLFTSHYSLFIFNWKLYLTFPILDLWNSRYENISLGSHLTFPILDLWNSRYENISPGSHFTFLIWFLHLFLAQTQLRSVTYNVGNSTFPAWQVLKSPLFLFPTFYRIYIFKNLEYSVYKKKRIFIGNNYI
jgi:hypothetical protein